MSTIYEKDLMPSVSREMGDLNSSNLRYDQDEIFTAINAGLEDFNLECPNQQYTVVGTGANAYFSPDPSTEDQRILVLYAALCLTNAEIQKAARTAYSHSNPAGRTDLTKIYEALIKQAERIEDRIKTAFSKRSRQLVEEELDEAGVELKGKPTESAEGVGIIEIIETN